MKILVTFLLLLMASCASHDIRPDTVPAATKSGYPTAEFYAAGHHFHGLGEVAMTKGDALDNLSLVVQGYYEGTIRVNSPDCHFDVVFDYANNQSYNIELPGKVDTNCVFGILVAPRYPNQSTSGVEVSDFLGFLRVRAINPGDQWYGNHSYVVDGAPISISVPTNVTQPLPVFFEGCGIKLSTTVVPKNGAITLPVPMASGPQTCVLEGILLTPPGQPNVLVTWYLAVYAKDFYPLPLPAVTLSNSKLVVTADPNVSVITLDTDGVLNTRAKFHMDPGKPHTLRLATTGGRSIIGDWYPEKQEWQWLR